MDRSGRGHTVRSNKSRDRKAAFFCSLDMSRVSISVVVKTAPTETEALSRQEDIEMETSPRHSEVDADRIV